MAAVLGGLDPAPCSQAPPPGTSFRVKIPRPLLGLLLGGFLVALLSPGTLLGLGACREGQECSDIWVAWGIWGGAPKALGALEGWWWKEAPKSLGALDTQDGAGVGAHLFAPRGPGALQPRAPAGQVPPPPPPSAALRPRCHHLGTVASRGQEAVGTGWGGGIIPDAWVPPP